MYTTCRQLYYCEKHFVVYISFYFGLIILVFSVQRKSNCHNSSLFCTFFCLHFAKYEVDSDLTEWYTPEDIQEKYGMTRVAIRSQVYRNNIPSKKEHGQIFYSKLHFDLSKSSEQESKAEYYTVKEAMEKFKLSRDSVYGILQFHQINREKNGRFVRFLKVEFDRVMGVHK